MVFVVLGLGEPSLMNGYLTHLHSPMHNTMLAIKEGVKTTYTLLV